MWHYEQAFKRHGIPVGQVLLTAQDISDRARYLNARNTLLALLDFGVLPIVNENDTVAVEEIKVGDNDNLSAPWSPRSSTPTCWSCSPTSTGSTPAIPRRDPAARRLDTVEAVTEDIAAAGLRRGGAGSRWAA